MSGISLMRPLRFGIWAWIFELLSFASVFCPSCGKILRANVGNWILSVHHRLVLCFFIHNHDGMDIDKFLQKCISINICISKNILFLFTVIEQFSNLPGPDLHWISNGKYSCKGISFIMAWWTNPFGETRQIRVIQKCAVLTSFLQVVYKNPLFKFMLYNSANDLGKCFSNIASFFSKQKKI